MEHTYRLTCGHSPSSHGEHTTGTAHLPDGGEVCCECANVWEDEQLRSAVRWSGYMSFDETGPHFAGRVTNWTGHVLGALCNVRRHTGNAFGHRYTYFTFTVIIAGGKWYGRGLGNGIHCSFRKPARKVGR